MMEYEEIRNWLTQRHILIVICDGNAEEDRIIQAFEQFKVTPTIKHCIGDGLYELRRNRGFEYDLVVTYVALPETNDYYGEIQDSGHQNDSRIREKGGIEMVRAWRQWCRDLGYANQVPVLYLAKPEANGFMQEGKLAAGVNNGEWLSTTVQAKMLIRIASKLISETPIGRDWFEDMKKTK